MNWITIIWDILKKRILSYFQYSIGNMDQKTYYKDFFSFQENEEVLANEDGSFHYFTGQFDPELSKTEKVFDVASTVLGAGKWVGKTVTLVITNQDRIILRINEDHINPLRILKKYESILKKFESTIKQGFMFNSQGIKEHADCIRFESLSERQTFQVNFPKSYAEKILKWFNGI